jgi:hypothetical protein
MQIFVKTTGDHHLEVGPDTIDNVKANRTRRVCLNITLSPGEEALCMSIFAASAVICLIAAADRVASS